MSTIPPSPNETVTPESSPPPADATGLSPEIEVKLQAMIRRVRRLSAVKGVAVTGAVAVPLILVIMGLDAALGLYAPGARWALSLLGWSVMLSCAYWYIARPLMRRIDLTDIARFVESHHPEVQERLSTVVELLTCKEVPNGQLGSRELLRQLEKEALNDAALLQPTEELSPRIIRPYVRAGSIALGLLALILVLFPGPGFRLLARALVPFVDVGTAFSGRLEIEPGDVEVLEGDPLVIQVRVDDPRADRVECIRIGADGEEQVERMLPDRNAATREMPAFTLRMPTLEASFEYRIRWRRAVSRAYEARLIQRPALDHLVVRMAYPAYTGRPENVVEGPPRDMAVPVGTRVTWEALLNRGDLAAELVVGDQSTPADPDPEDPRKRTWTKPVPAGLKAVWRLALSDDRDLTNRPWERMIEALDDQSPRVTWVDPEARRMNVRRDELLPVEVLVREDYGIKDARITFKLHGKDLAPVTMPVEFVEGEDGPSWTGCGFVDLKSMPTQGAAEMQVRVVARDNRPEEWGGAQEGKTSILTLVFTDASRGRTLDSLDAQRESWSDTLKQTQQELQKSKNQMQQVHNQLTRRPEEKDMLPQTANRLEQLRQELAQTLDQLARQADELHETAFEPVVEEDMSTLTPDIREALDETLQVPLEEDAQAQADHAEQAMKALEEAIEQAVSMQQDLDAMAPELEELARRAELAQEQQFLADQAEVAAEQSQSNLESPPAWQQRQSDFNQELGDFITQEPDALAAQQAHEAQQARDLAERARELADQHQAWSEKPESSPAPSGEEPSGSPSSPEQAEEWSQQAAELASEAQELVDGMQAREPDRGDLQTADAALQQLEERAADVAAGAEAAQQGEESGSPESGSPEEAGSPEPGSPEEAGSPEPGSPESGSTEESGSESGSPEPGDSSSPLSDAAPAVGDEAFREAWSEAGQAAEDSAQALEALAASAPEPGEGQGNENTQSAPGASPPEAGAPIPAGQESPAGNTPPGTPAAELAAGFQDAVHAAAEPAPAEAAGSAQQAAEHLSQSALQAALALGLDGSQLSRSYQPAPPGSTPAPSGQGEPSYELTELPFEMPEFLRRLGLSIGEWARLRGFLKKDASGMNVEDIPEEYRDLARRYFRALAEEGGRHDR